MRTIASIAILSCTLCAAGLQTASAASLLDQVFPRARQTCYGAKARAGTTAAIAMIRLTRPERLQSYDTRDSRIVRVVINFSGGKALRLEDSVNCRDDSGRLSCQSTTCEGGGFTIEPQGNGVLLRQKPASPDVIWACETDAIRSIELTERETALSLARATGSCL